MSTKKEIFKHLAQKGIYLPAYQLEKAEQLIKSQKSYFAGINLIEKEESFKKYKDASFGAYSIEEDHMSDKRISIIRINANGLEEGFPSLYAAAAACGKQKGFGNISKAIKKNSIAYGFRWKLKL